MFIERKQTIVVCKFCGKSFIKQTCLIKYRINLFCSIGCSKAFQKIPKNNPNYNGGKVKTICGHCSKTIYKTRSQFKKYKRHFCSPGCREIGKRTLVTVECVHCGNYTTKTKSYLKKYPISFCNRSCRAKWMVQENNPAWRNGAKAEPYCPVWLDLEYKKSIKERDGCRCANPMCFMVTNRLVVHHIDYNKKNCAPANLITLCNSCNSIANTDREWHVNWYRAIMNKRYKINYENRQ